MKRLFGTNGVRGVTNRELTAELALGMGKAIGTYFNEKSKVLVGRDIRAGGDMLVRALTSGLLSAGIDVYYAGILPTPTLQYGIKNGKYDGGVMVTASHNPPEFNGIKVIDADGVETSSLNEEMIEEYYFSRKFREVEWRDLGHDVKEVPGLIDQYVKGILRHVDVKRIRERRFRVLVDGGSSVGSLTSVKVARELGCELHEIGTELDPLFRQRLPEPTPMSLKKTAELATRLKVDIAVAHDGDADRAIFIDSDGKVQLGDRSGVLLAYWVSLKEKPRSKIVATPFSSSNLVDEFLEKHGIKTEWTHIGSIHVSRKLIENGGFAGFEDNGGFIYPKHQYVRDGAMAFALMLDFLASQKKSSAELFDMLPKYNSEKIKIPIANGMNVDDILSKVNEKYMNSGKVVNTDRDGVKIVGKDFWFIVRKSGTEPVIRVSVEAKGKAKLDQTIENLKKIIF
ncbi:MAG: phosphoglucosamine mutase [Candidatus Micrarchaeota archaeon]|nr:phosphoglucosamine mutase [Candidatus Micrarchaeota archaeon]MDE1858941.1 phosphoglucosamine mutase [Candidatus Micrarchaeota archaeon]